MSKTSNKQPNKSQTPVPKKHVEPPTLNQEFYENRLKEREQKLYDEERVAFAKWLTENEKELAAIYLRCADNMEKMCRRWQEHFYGKLGEKVVLPLKQLQDAIASSTQLTEEHRSLFRGAIDAYLRYRGLNLTAKPVPVAKKNVEPTVWHPSSTSTVRSLKAKEAKAVSSTASLRTKKTTEPRVSRQRISLRAAREAPSDPRTVSHEVLLQRLHGEIGEELDYEQISPLLVRINSEFAEHELIGDIAISDEEYKVLRGYFRTTYRTNYSKHLLAENNPEAPEAQEDENFALDKPSLVALVEMGKRVGDLDYWDTLANYIYGIDSDKFDQSWLESAFSRGMRQAGKAMASTNKQRVLNTILGHAKRQP